MPGNGRMGAISSACAQVYPGAFGPNCEMSPFDVLTLLRNHIRATPISTLAAAAAGAVLQIFARQWCRRCYPGCMTVFRHDHDLLTGMPTSTVALSCAENLSAIAAVRTMQEPRSSRQPRCFRLSSQTSATSVGRAPRPEAWGQRKFSQVSQHCRLPSQERRLTFL